MWSRGSWHDNTVSFILLLVTDIRPGLRNLPLSLEGCLLEFSYAYKGQRSRSLNCWKNPTMTPLWRKSVLDPSGKCMLDCAGPRWKGRDISNVPYYYSVYCTLFLPVKLKPTQTESTGFML